MIQESNIPFIELHLHLEGSVNMISGNNRTLQSANISNFMKLYWMNMKKFIDQNSYYTAGKKLGKYFIMNNISYAELSLLPSAFNISSLRIVDILPFVKRGMIDVGCKSEIFFLVEIIRDFVGLNKKEDVVVAAVEGKKHGVIGISVTGNEFVWSPKDYESLVELSHKRGLKVVAHLGEFCDGNHILDIIKKVRLDRIDHCLSAVNHITLLNVLKREQLPVTMCPSSNVILSRVKNYRCHPVFFLLNRGVKVSISSDDPFLLDTMIIKEFEKLSTNPLFSLENIKKLKDNAISSRFF